MFDTLQIKFTIGACFTWIITLVADLKAAFDVMSIKKLMMLFVIPWNHFKMCTFSNFTKYATIFLRHLSLNDNVALCFLIVSRFLACKWFLSFALTGNALGRWAVLQNEGSWRSGRGMAAARAENWPTTSTWRPVADHRSIASLSFLIFRLL